jgi:hypothetical protein
VWLASEPAGPAGVVLPAGLECVIRDVELVVGGEVLAEDERDLVGELLRVGRGDAEDSDPEVLRADDAVG